MASSRLRRRARTTAWLFASLLAAASAHADPSAADRETARTLMQQGRELRVKGDLKEALKRFQAADEIMHVPSTALEVARAQVAVGQLVEARDTIATIRRIAPRPNEPQPFREARAKAEELDSALNGRVPSLNIVVKGAPSGETPTVSIDGDALPAGVLGLPRALDPGHHVVVAKTANGEGKQEVDVNEGEQKGVEIALIVSATPVATNEPAPTDAAPETTEPAGRSHGPTALTWTGVGVVGVGVIAGTITGVASMMKKSTLQNECTNQICGPTSYSDYSAANTLATISTIGFIGAGAGAVVVAVTLIAGHGSSAAAAPAAPATGVTVRPTIGFGVAGVSGTF